MLITEIKNQLEKGASFSFESTLSGRTWAHLLSEAKALGYEIIIYFLYLDNVKKNISRIKKRVQMGGHNIPTESVHRRHPRCFENFWNLYRPLATEWHVFNNSGKSPKKLMSRQEFELLPLKKQEQFIKLFSQGKSYDFRRK